MILRDAHPDIIQGVASFVARELGLHFPGDRHRELERGIQAAAKEMGFADGEALARRIVEGGLPEDQMTVLTDHLTIGETYFLRDRALFDALEQVILPELLPQRAPEGPPVRIWSAGCSTGEEPFSVAMAAHRCLSNHPGASVSILATDVNARFLERAAKGVYGEWSFRSTPDWVRDRYFHELDEGTFRINNRIRDMVAFSRLNLKDLASRVGTLHTQGMDVILCRNVLMYFDRDTRQEILDHLVGSLAVEGWLFVSPTEIAIIDHPDLSKVRFPGLFCFKKVEAERDLRAGVGRSREPDRRVGSIFPSALRHPRARPVKGTAPRSSPRASRVSRSRPREVEPPKTQPRETQPQQARSEEVPHRQPPSQQEVLAGAEALLEKGGFQEIIDLLEPYMAATERGSHTRAQDRGLPAVLSRAYANLGLLDEALHWCEVALRSEGSSASHHLLHADIFDELGEADSSRAALRRALYLEPDSVIGRFRMGMACRKDGRLADAHRWFRGIMDLLASFEDHEVVADSDGRSVAEVREVVDAVLTEVVP